MPARCSRSSVAKGLPAAFSAFILVCGVGVPLSGVAAEPPFCQAECGRLFGTPKPTKPTCRKTVTRKVLQGGAFKTLTTPVKACIAKFEAYGPALKAWMTLEGERAPFGDQARCLSMCGELVAMRGDSPVPQDVKRVSDVLRGVVLTPAQLKSPLIETLGVNTKGESINIELVPSGAELEVGGEAVVKDSMTSEGRLFFTVRHGYPGEVRAKLQAPDGADLELDFVKGVRTGRGEMRFEYTYSALAPTRGNGTWTLIISDVARGGSGLLGPWKVESTGPDPFEMSQGSFDAPVEIPDVASNTTTQTFKPKRVFDSGLVPFTATFPGHAVYRGTVELPVGGIGRYTGQMKAITGQLAVEPNGATRVSLSAVNIPMLAVQPDGTVFAFEGAKASQREVAGETAKWDGLIVGEYTVTLDHPCYRPQVETITIREGETTQLRFAKGGQNTLRIEVDPVGASVSLNGHDAGKAPLECRNMGAGDVKVFVSKADHDTAKETVTLGAEGETDRRYLLWSAPSDNDRFFQWEKTLMQGAALVFFWMPKWTVEHRQLSIAGEPFSYLSGDPNVLGLGFETELNKTFRVFGHIAGPVLVYPREMPDFLEPTKSDSLGLGGGLEIGLRGRLSRREWGNRFPLEARLRIDFFSLTRERPEPSVTPGETGESVSRFFYTIEPALRWYFAYTPRHYIAPTSHLVWLTGRWDALNGPMADIDELIHYAGVHLGGTIGRYDYSGSDALWRFDYHLYFETDTHADRMWENNIMGGGLTVSITEE